MIDIGQVDKDSAATSYQWPNSFLQLTRGFVYDPATTFNGCDSIVKFVFRFIDLIMKRTARRSTHPVSLRQAKIFGNTSIYLAWCVHAASTKDHFSPEQNYSVETASCLPSRAAISVCHAKLAHFTRTGNSDTPANTANLPRASGSPSACPVTRL